MSACRVPIGLFARRVSSYNGNSVGVIILLAYSGGDVSFVVFSGILVSAKHRIIAKITPLALARASHTEKWRRGRSISWKYSNE